MSIRDFSGEFGGCRVPTTLVSRSQIVRGEHRCRPQSGSWISWRCAVEKPGASSNFKSHTKCEPAFTPALGTCEDSYAADAQERQDGPAFFQVVEAVFDSHEFRAGGASFLPTRPKRAARIIALSAIVMTTTVPITDNACAASKCLLACAIEDDSTDDEREAFVPPSRYGR